MNRNFTLINPFHMNDWKIKRFFIVVLTLQLLLFGSIGLETIGLQIPLIRQIAGFVYLTLVPGTLILRILRIHKIDNIETIIYTVGLSIFNLMFIGSFMNTFFPVIGISRPLSSSIIIITISIFTCVQCIICYMRDSDYSFETFIKVREILSPSPLLLCLLPFLSVFGTYYTNYYNYDGIIYILLTFLSIIPLLVVYFNFPKEKYYAFTVFMIAIALIYHWSLIGTYLFGSDIHYEYYFAKLITTEGIWNSKASSPANSVLSVVMLAPIISYMCNLSLIWTFKIVYPLLYALVPLGLYSVLKNQIDNKSAFLSVFFFMSVYPFFAEMIQLARQQIAEIFLVSLILLMQNRNMKNSNRAVLTILFAISLGVSHYGVSYIFLVILIGSYIVINVNRQCKSEKINITYTFILLYIVFIFTWYMNISNATVFNTVVHIGDEIIGSLTSITDMNTAQGISMVKYNYSFWHNICKDFYILSQLFITIGVVKVILKPKEHKFAQEYRAFSIISLILCLFGLVVPNFASALNTTRLFHILLFFLAPFFITGVKSSFEFVSKIKTIDVSIVPKIYSIYLMFFLLLTSGYIYEIVHDKPVSIALNSTFDTARYTEKDAYAATWTSLAISNSIIYSDPYGNYFLNELLSTNKNLFLKTDLQKGYLYLREINHRDNQVLLFNKTNELVHGDYQKLDEQKFYLDASKIYSNGGSSILLM